MAHIGQRYVVNQMQNVTNALLLIFHIHVRVKLAKCDFVWCNMILAATRDNRSTGFLIRSDTKKVQVGKDQEKAQSEKDSHSKNRGGKKPN